jgi:ligand-binding sensor domain-containing protein
MNAGRESRTSASLAGVRAALAATLVFAAAATASTETAGLHVTHYGQDDGLPSEALQMARTASDGFLYVATSQGLVRYDGRRWRIWARASTPALRGNEVSAIQPLDDGSLVLALAMGDVLRHDGREGFSRIAEPGTLVTELSVAADGAIQAVGLAALRIVDGRTEVVAARPGRDWPLVQFSIDGRSYLVDSLAGEVMRFEGGAGSSRIVARFDAAPRDLVAPWVDGNGAWLLSINGLWRFEPGQEVVVRHEWSRRFKPSVVSRGPDGHVWIGGAGREHSLCRTPRIEPDFDCHPVEVGARNITDLHLDPSGALWVSSWDAGLTRIASTPFRRYGAGDGVVGRVRSFTSLADGRVAFHTGAMLHVADGAEVSSFPWPPPAEPDDAVFALLGLPDGRLLRGRLRGIDVATPPAYADWRRHDAGLEPPATAYAFGIDRQGAVWTGDTRMLRYRAGAWATVQPGARLVYAYTLDRDGRLWAATQQGIWRQQADGHWVVADAPAPAGRFIAMSALTDSRGHLWFGGYESGLYRYDGARWLRIDVTRGLPDDTAYGLVEDERGRIWVSHGRGLYTLDLDEADRAAGDDARRVVVRSYTAADGLDVPGFNGGAGTAALRARDGAIWLASDAGAVRFDPARLPTASPPPRVVVDAITVDGRPLAPATRIELAPGTQRIDLVVAMPAPGWEQRLSGRYRLVGLDAQWATLPVHGAIGWQRLPVGTHRLEIEASVDDGPWVPGVTLAIEQHPAWWQQAWAWWIGVLTVVGIIAAAVRARELRLREHNRRLQQIVEARSRELAAERLALTDAQAAQAEAERALAWHRRARALELWSEVDNLGRAVAVALAALPDGGGAAEVAARLAMHATPEAVPQAPDDVAGTLTRLQAAGVVVAAGVGRWRLADGDWASLPDFAQPLDALVARASRRVGAYRLGRRLGEGAMGEVWHGTNVHDGSAAAVKLVHRDLGADPRVRQRFQREGDVVGALDHPHIVRLLERGEHDGRLYLAMEYLEGSTLAERLQRGDPIPQHDAVAILHGLAAALVALHARGVAHRDLHPGNVMIQRDGTVKLLDFGLSRDLAASMATRSHALVGSLPYLAPELLRGDPGGAAADLFALGCIGYELLAGVRLWRGTHTIALIAEIAQHEAVDPARLATLPDSLRAVISRLIDPDPTRRGDAAAAESSFAGILAMVDAY